MRVYIMKNFRRFQRKEGIADAALCEAVARAERCLVDANLGGGLIKQRVARKGQGRSGGFRTLIAYRANDRAVFLHGFAKRDRDSIDDNELEALQRIGKSVLDAGTEHVENMIADDRLMEIYCG